MTTDSPRRRLGLKKPTIQTAPLSNDVPPTNIEKDPPRARARDRKQVIAKVSKEFEAQVRLSARLLWNREARQEAINNVVYDTVVHLTAQHWVIIETTISRDLSKVREDLNRLSLARLFLLTDKHIVVEPYIILQEEPTPDMLATARGVNIEILSLPQLKARLFDFSSYATQRGTLPFGSAVLPDSGEQDRSAYTPVTYLTAGKTTDIAIDAICSRISGGEQLILVGEYGTGKSRCIQECFHRLADRAEAAFCYPIAINLRDCWGLETAEEIIGRHLRRLGLSSMIDRVMRLLGAGSIALLLDGFDELGTQSWTDDMARLQDLRARALRGVRDLVSVTRGGIFIAGREHYFDGNREMVAALGLRSGVGLLSCKTEFTVPEMKAYLRDRHIDRQPPEWLPRRPLMVQILSSFDSKTLGEVISASSGAVKFWNLFVAAFCEREAKAKDTMLDADTIRLIMQRLARLTRTKNSDVGPLTQTEIRSAFEAVLGTTAIDESRIILQRLSGLGRVSNESDDRQFVDAYLLDGFRALDAQHLISLGDRAGFAERWVNPLRSLGQLVLGSAISSNQKGAFLYARHCASQGNSVLAGDIVAAICATRSGAVDFGGIDIQSCYFVELNCHAIVPSNLTLRGCIIHRFIAPRSSGEGFALDGCEIELMFGESDWQPLYMTDCRIDFQRAVSVPLERLSPGHKALVVILTTLWETPGKSSNLATVRRVGAKAASASTASRVLEILIKEEELVRVDPRRRGAPDSVRLNRDARHRILGLLRDMHLTEDIVWQKVANLA